MLIGKWYHVPTTLSLIIVGSIIVLSVLFSVIAGSKDAKRH
jgi:hypothetical protein